MTISKKQSSARKCKVLSTEKKVELDIIINKFAESIDELALKHEKELKECLKKTRILCPDCADEIENTFTELYTDARYGTTLGAYLKSEHIRPIQRKYTGEK